MKFLNTPLTFFWYGVLQNMHTNNDLGDPELLEYAKATILSAANVSEKQRKNDASWILLRSDAVDSKEYCQKTWSFASWFVNSGRASLYFDGAPSQVGALQITAEGIQVNSAKMPKSKNAKRIGKSDSNGKTWSASPF